MSFEQTLNEKMNAVQEAVLGHGYEVVSVEVQLKKSGRSAFVESDGGKIIISDCRDDLYKTVEEALSPKEGENE